MQEDRRRARDGNARFESDPTRRELAGGQSNCAGLASLLGTLRAGPTVRCSGQTRMVAASSDGRRAKPDPDVLLAAESRTVSSLVLSLRPGVSVTSRADELEFQGETGRISFKRVVPAVCNAMEQLANGGACEDAMTDAVMHAGGSDQLPRMYYYRQRLAQLGILQRSARHGETVLATLTPTSRWFTFDERRIEAEYRYVLSRFAYMHRFDNELLLESPLAHAKITLHDWRATALMHVLAEPCRTVDILGSIDGLDADAVEQLLTLLLGTGMARQLNDDGTTAEEDDYALQVWEFQDLLFHSRSRCGRHDNPVGGTYRFAGQLDPPPVLKPAMASEFVELHRPDLDRLQRDDLPYALVQETRCSIREFGDPPINAKQLGEFLFRVGRVKDIREHDIPTPNGSLRMDFALRPYPGGGALYELELYPVVNHCT